MKRIYLIAALLSVSMSAFADDRPAPPLVGSIVGGANAYLSQDGDLTVTTPGRIKLENGRELERHGEKWSFVDATDSGGIRTVSGLDFSAYGKEYVGQQVRIIGGEIYGTDADGGILKLPGSFVHLDFGALPRDQVKILIRDCAGIMTGGECKFTVTGTVGRSYSGLALTGLSIANPERPISGPRRRP